MAAEMSPGIGTLPSRDTFALTTGTSTAPAGVADATTLAAMVAAARTRRTAAPEREWRWTPPRVTSTGCFAAFGGLSCTLRAQQRTACGARLVSWAAPPV